MKITVLVENTSRREDIGAEHGLSLFIETEEKRLLFDMGQSELLFENAKKLGIDLSDVDAAIISHGHYDHGGGLERFLTVNKHAPVFIRQEAFLPHYNAKGRYIGLDGKSKKSNRLTFVGDEYEIFPNMRLFTLNNHKKRFSDILPHSGLTEERDGKRTLDEFFHEQYLEIFENGKKVIVSGCSHKGILDITDATCPDVLIGGFHLSKLSIDDGIDKACELLSGFSAEYYTCHCTGTEMYDFLKKSMPRLRYISGGDVIVI